MNARQCCVTFHFFGTKFLLRRNFTIEELELYYCELELSSIRSGTCTTLNCSCTYKRTKRRTTLRGRFQRPIWICDHAQKEWSEGDTATEWGVNVANFPRFCGEGRKRKHGKTSWNFWNDCGIDCLVKYFFVSSFIVLFGRVLGRGETIQWRFSGESRVTIQSTSKDRSLPPHICEPPRLA